MITAIEDRVLDAIAKVLATGVSRVSVTRVAVETDLGVAAVRNAFRVLRDEGCFRRFTDLDRLAYPPFVSELA